MGSDSAPNPGTVTNDMLLRHKVWPLSSISTLVFFS